MKASSKNNMNKQRTSQEELRGLVSKVREARKRTDSVNSRQDTSIQVEGGTERAVLADVIGKIGKLDGSLSARRAEMS